MQLLALADSVIRDARRKAVGHGMPRWAGLRLRDREMGSFRGYVGRQNKCGASLEASGWAKRAAETDVSAAIELDGINVSNHGDDCK